MSPSHLSLSRIQTTPQDIVLQIARYLSRFDLLSLSQSCQSILHISQHFATYWDHDIIPALLPAGWISAGITPHNLRQAALHATRLRSRLETNNQTTPKVVEIPLSKFSHLHMTLNTRFLFLFRHDGDIVECHDMWIGKLIGEYVIQANKRRSSFLDSHIAHIGSKSISPTEIIMIVADQAENWMVLYLLRISITTDGRDFCANFVQMDWKEVAVSYGELIDRIVIEQGYLVLILSIEQSPTRLLLWEGYRDTGSLIIFDKDVEASANSVDFQTCSHDQGDQETLSMSHHSFPLGTTVEIFSRPTHGLHSQVQDSDCSDFPLRSNLAKPSFDSTKFVTSTPQQIKYTLHVTVEVDRDGIASKIITREALYFQTKSERAYFTIEGKAAVYWQNLDKFSWAWGGLVDDCNINSSGGTLKGEFEPGLTLFDSESGSVVKFNLGQAVFWFC